MIDNSSEMERWHRENGLEKYNQFLHTGIPWPIIFDLGAYDGQWAKKVSEIAFSDIYSFEPVKEYYNQALDNLGVLAKVGSVRIYNFALGKKDSTEIISVNGDGSSLFLSGDKKEEIKVVDFHKFVQEKNIESVDLMKINIEGSEYDLLDYLLDSDYIKNISSILIQFHSFFDNAESRRNSIRERLKETHNEIFNYNFVWEGWKKK